ncbi:hypothetical protein HUJ05_006172 [Dendroctonus ponderosae]|nr:hypothetical protein HUJ05_006172 [Dendroctonus ponderosae]
MALQIRHARKCFTVFPVITKLFRSFNGKRMPITKEHIESKLQKELEATHVDVVDHSGGCGEKFACLVVSDKFEGKPLLQRHRLVNNVLKEELAQIHALSLQTLTTKQWAAEQ